MRAKSVTTVAIDKSVLDSLDYLVAQFRVRHLGKKTRRECLQEAVIEYVNKHSVDLVVSREEPEEPYEEDL